MLVANHKGLEIAIIDYLLVASNNEHRKYKDVNDQKLAVAIYHKIEKYVPNPDAKPEDQKYQDASIEWTEEEKKFLLDCIDQEKSGWKFNQLQGKLDLQDKLNGTYVERPAENAPATDAAQANTGAGSEAVAQ